jgi:hypothetical protein
MILLIKNRKFIISLKRIVILLIFICIPTTSSFAQISLRRNKKLENEK